MGIRRLETYLNGQRVYICIFGRKRRRKCATKSEGSAQSGGFVEGGGGAKTLRLTESLPRFRQYGRRPPLIRTQTHNLQWAKQYVGLPPQTGWGTILGSYVQWSLEERFPCN